MNTPLIKWTGSKRHLANNILTYLPNEISIYYEPFLGGGSVFLQTLKNNINVKKYMLSDINVGLIDIFKLVKDSPNDLILSYKDKWEEQQRDKDFYYKQREYYNSTKDPHAFYFLTRTCYNGTIRYNKQGEFNTSHHFGRKGMHPLKVEKIVNYYSSLMYNKDIEFKNTSYENINLPIKGDLVYLDPPYSNSKSLYYGDIDTYRLFGWVNKLDCSWLLNINGVNKTNNEIDVPIDYTERVLLKSGNSSFSRMKGVNIDVGEYLYYKIK
jgi:DNA adenine methylase